MKRWKIFLPLLLVLSLCACGEKEPEHSAPQPEYPAPTTEEFSAPVSRFRMVTPRMVQLVVIRGRYTPRALYRAGMNFFRKFSSNWTRMAIIRINTMVWR